MTLPERTLKAPIAADWIRACLGVAAGQAQLTVSGTCMDPVMTAGEQISLRSPAPPPLVGDVVLVRTAAGLRLHRVVLRFGEWIRTKGDRGTYLDPAARTTDVVAIADSGETLLRKRWQAGRSLIRMWRRF